MVRVLHPPPPKNKGRGRGEAPQNLKVGGVWHKMGVFEWDGGDEGGQHPKIWGIGGLHPNNGGGLGVLGFFRRSWGGHL